MQKEKIAKLMIKASDDEISKAEFMVGFYEFLAKDKDKEEKAKIDLKISQLNDMIKSNKATLKNLKDYIKA